MDKNKVSVIIPTYNCADYLPGAIESVLNQTYKNYEIIVIDDGSSDNTIEVISTYRNKINYISQENGGVSKARNTGIKNAQGNYIAFLDVDDRWYPFKLEFQMQCFAMLPKVSLIFSDFSALQKGNITSHSHFCNAFNIFNEYNIRISDIFSNETQLFNAIEDNTRVFWGNVFNSLFLGNFILPSTVILKKECLKSVGFFNEHYRVAEETNFFLRFSKYFELAFIDKPLVQYKLPDDMNLTAKKNTDALIKNALQTQFQVIKEDPIFYEDHKRLAQKAIGKTYYRLSYFYFSELNKNQAHVNSIKSIKFNPWQLKAYAILFLTFFPPKALKLLAIIKHKKHQKNKIN